MLVARNNVESFDPSFFPPCVKSLHISYQHLPFLWAYIDSTGSLSGLTHLSAFYNPPHVTMPSFNDQQIPVIPPSVTHLVLPGDNRKVILPSSLHTLYLSKSFAPPILPSSLRRLMYDDQVAIPNMKKADLALFTEFTRQLSLPPNLTHLSLPDDFNDPIKYFPHSLTNLKFGWKFDQPIEASTLPPNITTLFFGGQFNQNVDHLPQGLKHLSVGYFFNQRYDIFPSSLRVPIKLFTVLIPFLPNCPPSTL